MCVPVIVALALLGLVGCLISGVLTAVETVTLGVLLLFLGAIAEISSE